MMCVRVVRVSVFKNVFTSPKDSHSLCTPGPQRNPYRGYVGAMAELAGRHQGLRGLRSSALRPLAPAVSKPPPGGGGQPA